MLQPNRLLPSMKLPAYDLIARVSKFCIKNARTSGTNVRVYAIYPVVGAAELAVNLR